MQMGLNLAPVSVVLVARERRSVTRPKSHITHDEDLFVVIVLLLLPGAGWMVPDLPFAASKLLASCSFQGAPWPPANIP